VSKRVHLITLYDNYLDQFWIFVPAIHSLLRSSFSLLKRLRFLANFNKITLSLNQGILLVVFDKFCKYFLFYLFFKIVVMFVCLAFVSLAINWIYMKQLVLFLYLYFDIFKHNLNPKALYTSPPL
jgi:hypothetical protein